MEVGVIQRRPDPLCKEISKLTTHMNELLAIQKKTQEELDKLQQSIEYNNQYNFNTQSKSGSHPYTDRLHNYNRSINTSQHRKRHVNYQTRVLGQ